MTQRDDAVDDNEDYGTNLPETSEPLGQSKGQGPHISKAHPATDSSNAQDSQELYDAGPSAAAGAAEPNAGNTVIGYQPPDKQTGKDDDEPATTA